MAKKKSSSRKQVRRNEKEQLRSYDVYQQPDEALVVLQAGDNPEDEDADHVITVDAINELDAIRQTKKKVGWTRDLAVANPDHDPDVSSDVREEAERRTNARLGITTRPASRKKSTRTAKSGAKKKSVKRKSTSRKRR